MMWVYLGFWARKKGLVGLWDLGVCVVMNMIFSRSGARLSFHGIFFPAYSSPEPQHIPSCFFRIGASFPNLQKCVFGVWLQTWGLGHLVVGFFLKKSGAENLANEENCVFSKGNFAPS